MYEAIVFIACLVVAASILHGSQFFLSLQFKRWKERRARHKRMRRDRAMALRD